MKKHGEHWREEKKRYLYDTHPPGLNLFSRVSNARALRPCQRHVLAPDAFALALARITSPRHVEAVHYYVELFGHLVSVVGGFVRSIDRDIQVLGLDIRQRRQLDAQLVQMGACDFFVELFRQDVDSQREFLRCCPKRDLSQSLVRKRARHDK